MLLTLLLLLTFFAGAGDPSSVLQSTYSAHDFSLNPDPNSQEWRHAPKVFAHVGYKGEEWPGPPTEIRSRWTTKNLYLLYICPYDELSLTPHPDPTHENPQLWHWDVAEAFIGSDFEHIGRYKEFEMSPQSESADFDINRDDPKSAEGAKWDSGFEVQARIDREHKVWYGVMRIPFAAIASRPPSKGAELRAGLFRITGIAEPRRRILWRPTGKTTLHVPQAFGILRLR
jgi:hypothetical protein